MQQKEFPYDPLQSLFYDLVRDSSPGLIEGIMKDLEKERVKITTVKYTNNYLADYAKELSDRLKKVLRDNEDATT